MSKSNKLYLTGFFIILFLPLLAVFPWFFPPEWGKAMAFRIVFSLIILLFLWQIISDKSFFSDIKQKYIANKKAIWLIFSILLLAIVSTLLSQDIIFSLWSSPHRSGGLINFIFCILFAVLLFLTLNQNAWNKLWNFAFLIGNIIVIFAIIQYFDLLPAKFIAYEGRPPSTLSNPILLAIYLILLFFPLLFFAIEEKSQKRFFYWLSLALFSFGIFISGSRAAYLGTIIAVFYFIILLPKKLKKIKIFTSFLLILAILAISYISFSPSLPSLIKENKRLSYLADRVSFNSVWEALGQTRFSAWKTFYGAVLEKPIFGWGVENQGIAFDKYYNPNFNYLVKLGQNWWDRAHNIFLDLSVSYGIPFLLLYLLLFIYLFIRLQKSKSKNPENKIRAHALQSAFIGYFIALLFGFDSVTTYIILFFLIGYTLYITSLEQTETLSLYNKDNSSVYHSLFRKRKTIITVLLIATIFFLWQYALKPIYVNGQINIAEKSTCDKRIKIMDGLLESKSFLNSYIRLHYSEDVKICASSSGKELDYINKAIKALEEESKIQPKYTRTWLLLAQFNNTLLAAEKDPKIKKELETKSLNYINEAKKLSPLRQENYAIEAQTYFAKSDFQNIKRVSQECLKIDENGGSCYWYLGLAEIMLNDIAQGQKDIEKAKEEGYEYNNIVSLSQLAVAYIQNKNYEELIEVYGKLLELQPKNIDFRARLAFVYKEIGQYQKARKEAIKLIHEHPEINSEIIEFLKTLPYPYSILP